MGTDTYKTLLVVDRLGHAFAASVDQGYPAFCVVLGWWAELTDEERELFDGPIDLAGAVAVRVRSLRPTSTEDPS